MRALSRTGLERTALKEFMTDPRSHQQLHVEEWGIIPGSPRLESVHLTTTPNWLHYNMMNEKPLVHFVLMYILQFVPYCNGVCREVTFFKSLRFTNIFIWDLKCKLSIIFKYTFKFHSSRAYLFGNVGYFSALIMVKNFVFV
ncbi:UNVERIFIED_CONTAM: hypothetical protein K2H54_048498 [Gekko kuhli]